MNPGIPPGTVPGGPELGADPGAPAYGALPPCTGGNHDVGPGACEPAGGPPGVAVEPARGAEPGYGAGPGVRGSWVVSSRIGGMP
ncbi:MAG: hypothetical protein ACRDUA_06960 [Micromonosporaceae bacterium]